MGLSYQLFNESQEQVGRISPRFSLTEIPVLFPISTWDLNPIYQPEVASECCAYTSIGVLLLCQSKRDLNPSIMVLWSATHTLSSWFDPHKNWWLTSKYLSMEYLSTALYFLVSRITNRVNLIVNLLSQGCQSYSFRSHQLKLGYQISPTCKELFLVIFGEGWMCCIVIFVYG